MKKVKKMRMELNVDEFDVEVTQRSMSKSTLHVNLETNDGDVELYMSPEKIQELINKMQKSLDEYKSRFHY